MYLLGCSGLLVEMYRVVRFPLDQQLGEARWLKIYFVAMALLAWLAVLSGTYMVYPWYRAAAPVGTVDLSLYPQRLLIRSSTTIGWHSLGMEWKEHVAWVTPIAITMAAYVFLKYGRDLRRQPWLRGIVMSFVLVSFITAGIAGFWGAMIDKVAPVGGGDTVQLIHGVIR
jgi:hypothetical protein